MSSNKNQVQKKDQSEKGKIKGTEKGPFLKNGRGFSFLEKEHKKEPKRATVNNPIVLRDLLADFAVEQTSLWRFFDVGLPPYVPVTCNRWVIVEIAYGRSADPLFGFFRRVQGQVPALRRLKLCLRRESDYFSIAPTLREVSKDPRFLDHLQLAALEVLFLRGNADIAGPHGPFIMPVNKTGSDEMQNLPRSPSRPSIRSDTHVFGPGAQMLRREVRHKAFFQAMVVSNAPSDICPNLTSFAFGRNHGRFPAESALFSMIRSRVKRPLPMRLSFLRIFHVWRYEELPITGSFRNTGLALALPPKSKPKPKQAILRRRKPFGQAKKHVPLDSAAPLMLGHCTSHRPSILEFEERKKLEICVNLKALLGCSPEITVMNYSACRRPEPATSSRPRHVIDPPSSRFPTTSQQSPRSAGGAPTPRSLTHHVVPRWIAPFWPCSGPRVLNSENSGEDPQRIPGADSHQDFYHEVVVCLCTAGRKLDANRKAPNQHALQQTRGKRS
ncbi:hypothetical protein DFH09DRAFT_1273246 [Mycena vulgaris]|nr:hypothetical protein DFH09DRAFT_1273246 [Mycena vulgaris]